MRSKLELQNASGQSGMALMAVMIMLVIMTIVGMGMYTLVQNTIAVSGGYSKRATTHSIAVAEASLVMELISDSFAAAAVSAPAGLTILDTGIMGDLQAMPGNDIITDTPDFNPDVQMILPGTNIVATADIDYLQSVPIAGGSIEFASAYDGVGAGQTLGSAFLVEHLVHVVATDAGGTRTDIRFISGN